MHQASVLYTSKFVRLVVADVCWWCHSATIVVPPLVPVTADSCLMYVPGLGHPVQSSCPLPPSLSLLPPPHSDLKRKPNRSVYRVFKNMEVMLTDRVLTGLIIVVKVECDLKVWTSSVDGCWLNGKGGLLIEGTMVQLHLWPFHSLENLSHIH